MLVWLSVWSKVQTCIWPSWCHCHSLSLASVKSRLVLPFWYRLTRIVPDKGPLKWMCVLLSISWADLSPEWFFECRSLWQFKWNYFAWNLVSSTDIGDHLRVHIYVYVCIYRHVIILFSLHIISARVRIICGPYYYLKHIHCTCGTVFALLQFNTAGFCLLCLCFNIPILCLGINHICR